MTLAAGGAFAAAFVDGGMIEARESPWTKHFSHGIWRELSSLVISGLRGINIINSHHPLFLVMT